MLAFLKRSGEKRVRSGSESSERNGGLRSRCRRESLSPFNGRDSLAGVDARLPRSPTFRNTSDRLDRPRRLMVTARSDSQDPSGNSSGSASSAYGTKEAYPADQRGNSPSPASDARRESELGGRPCRPGGWGAFHVGSATATRHDLERFAARQVEAAHRLWQPDQSLWSPVRVSAWRQGGERTGARSARGAPNPEDSTRGAGAAGHRRPHARSRRRSHRRTRHRRAPTGTRASPGTGTASSGD